LRGNSSVFNFHKNELENVNFCPNLLGQQLFVLFLGEFKKPKSPFEINGPLAFPELKNQDLQSDSVESVQFYRKKPNLKPPREENCVPSEASLWPPCLPDVALGVTGAMAALEVMSAIS
jgi:hypothetical protein